MSELSELYQQVILDHNKKPRNFRKPETFNHRAEGHNPLCGDQLTVYVQLDGGIVTDVAFEGSGCAISKAAASMMTQALIGNLRIFSGVREFPVRVKCATLPWHTMQAALHGQAVTSTE